VSSPRRLGLPEARRMRHDLHFVEQLAHPSGIPIGRMVPVEDIDPNPNQPRRSLGDLAELTASVREKGLLEPILVRARDKRFQIVAGERRYRAALDAGLAEVPCIVKDISDADAMEIALIENLQRKDLDAFEEADGLKALAERFGHTHEQIAKQIGKSRSLITETLSLSAMPQEVRELCRLADIASKSVLLQIVRSGDAREMLAFVDRLNQGGSTTRAAARDLSQPRQDKNRSASRARPFVFRYRPKEKGFHLMLRFRKAEASREEIVAALQRALAELMEEKRG
jgi:ParB family transcriptional regulator, chromosome partitioning protein